MWATRAPLCKKTVEEDFRLLRPIFRCLAMPAGSYAAEVWATSRLAPDATAVDANEVAGAYVSALRRMLGLRPAVSKWIVYGEWGMRPLQMDWAKRTARFWNGLVQLATSSHLVASAVQANIEAGLPRGQDATPQLQGLWSAQVHRAFSHVMDPTTLLRTLEGGRPLVVDDIFKGYNRAHSAYWAGPWGDPRAPECRNRASASYAKQFRGVGCKLAAHLTAAIPAKHKILLSRLRAGCHGLPTDVICTRKPGSQPWCPHCGHGYVGDPHHVVFDCPITAHLRLELQDNHGVDIHAFATLPACFASVGQADHSVHGPVLAYIVHCLNAFRASA